MVRPTLPVPPATATTTDIFKCILTSKLNYFSAVQVCSVFEIEMEDIRQSLDSQMDMIPRRSIYIRENERHFLYIQMVIIYFYNLSALMCKH